MIEVIYCRSKHRLTVKGHANSGEKGRDLVCASASILAYTLASFVTNLAESGQATAKVIKLKEGNAKVSCQTHARNEAAVTLAFDAICAGYDLLANSYPQYIHYEIV